jgi:hypothetical protein
VQWATLIVAFVAAIVVGGLLGMAAIVAIHHAPTVMDDEIGSM